MKVDLRVRELVIEGLADGDREAFTRRLQQELARRLQAGELTGDAVGREPGGVTRKVASRSLTTDRPLERAADAADEVARVVQREVSR